MNRPFLCGFCAADEVLELRKKQCQDPEQSPITCKFSSLYNGDYNEQYGRRDNVRMFEVNKEADQDVYQNVVVVAMKVGHQISKSDMSICHRVITTVNNDITLLRARLAKALVLRADIKAVVMLNEKVVIYETDESKIFFENLFKLYEWDPVFIYPACKTSLHFC